MAKRSFFRDNGLSIVLLLLFLGLAVGLALSGWSQYNSGRARFGEKPASLEHYLASPDFGEAVFENWESEFLQMGLYVVLTAFLFQRGSAESKDPDAVEKAPRGNPRSPGTHKRGGVMSGIYKCSLSIAFAVLFLGSFVGHALCGLGAVNEEARRFGEPAMTLWGYVSGSQFWFESFQNWQSEFLAMFAIVVLSIWLRQQGSPESKPVEAAHDDTGN